MKRFLSLFILTIVIMNCLVFNVLSANAETNKRDILYDGATRGNYAPTQQTSLPYQASWNSVVTYTYTNYYFKGYSSIDVTIDVVMNYSNSTGRFYVYLYDKTAGSNTCILDSGSAASSYQGSTTVSLISSHSYYLKFSKTGNRSCSGQIDISN